MVDIQSAAAEIRRGKKKKKKKQTTGQKYNGVPYYIEQPYSNHASVHRIPDNNHAKICEHWLKMYVSQLWNYSTNQPVTHFTVFP